MKFTCVRLASVLLLRKVRFAQGPIRKNPGSQDVAPARFAHGKHVVRARVLACMIHGDQFSRVARAPGGPNRMKNAMPDSIPTRWQPKRIPAPSDITAPPVLSALWRGVRCRCPVCGQSPVFATWLGVVPACAACHAPLGLISADDAPPYFTVFIVAHVIIALMFGLETVAALSVGMETAIMLGVALTMVLVLIRPVKGATVGLMLKLGFMKSGHQAGNG